VGAPVRPTLLIPLKNRGHFLELYFEKSGLAGLFVKGDVDLKLGDEVDLEVQFLEEQRTFRVRGAVRWRRAIAGRASLPPGLGIEFVPEDVRAQKHLVDFAMGREVPLVHREDRRFDAHIKVKVNAAGIKETSETDDISEHGAFIITDAPFDVGETFTLTLHPPRAIFPVLLQARVKWRRLEPKAGIGVEFVYENEKTKARVAGLVAKLKTQMIRELRVRVPKLTEHR
jgi:Tfp pilus assembly protein PilZ